MGSDQLSGMPAVAFWNTEKRDEKRARDGLKRLEHATS